MTRRITVTFENGVLVPQEKINLPEHRNIVILVDDQYLDDPPPSGGPELIDWQARHRIHIAPEMADKIIHSKDYEYYEEPDDES